MQAIQTKKTKPTETRGARMRATCDGASVTIGYDHSINLESNHRAAAEALAVKLGWTVENGCCPIESGSLKDGSWVHVFSESAKAVLLVRVAMSKGDNNGNPWCKPWGRAIGALTDKDQGGSAYLAGALVEMTARLAKVEG